MGRQKSGYDVLLLITNSFLFQFDCYIIRYREGSHVPPHRDPNPAGKHYRLNIVIKRARKGGEFQCDQTIFQSNRIKLFRPDLYKHSVSKVEEGSRYVLSIGWLLP